MAIAKTWQAGHAGAEPAVAARCLGRREREREASYCMIQIGYGTHVAEDGEDEKRCSCGLLGSGALQAGAVRLPLLVDVLLLAFGVHRRLPEQYFGLLRVAAHRCQRASCPRSVVVSPSATCSLLSCCCCCFDWVYYEALNSNTTYKKPRQVISRFVIS